VIAVLEMEASVTIHAKAGGSDTASTLP